MLKYKNAIAFGMLGCLIALLGFQAHHMGAIFAGIGLAMIALFVGMKSAPKSDAAGKDASAGIDLSKFAGAFALVIICVGLMIALFGRDLILRALDGAFNLESAFKRNTY